MSCTACGRDNPAHYKFCLACGAILAREPVRDDPALAADRPDPSDERSCPACGKTHGSGSLFCQGCGASLDGLDPASPGSSRGPNEPLAADATPDVERGRPTAVEPDDPDRRTPPVDVPRPEATPSDDANDRRSTYVVLAIIVTAILGGMALMLQ